MKFYNKTEKYIYNEWYVLYIMISSKIILSLCFILVLMSSSCFSLYYLYIDNPNSYDLIDFQVKVNIPNIKYYNFKIVDQNGNEIPYCFEQPNGECTTSKTNTIWIKANLTPGKNTFYVIPSTTNHAVNGDQVFDFYDDFNDGSWQDKWNSVDAWCRDQSTGGYPIENDGKIILRTESGYGGLKVTSKNKLYGEYLVDFSAKVKQVIGPYPAIFVGNATCSPVYLVDDCGASCKIHTYGITNFNNSYKIYDNIHITFNGSYLLIADWDVEVLYDWIRVRKYAPQEPTVLKTTYISISSDKDYKNITIKNCLINTTDGSAIYLLNVSLDSLVLENNNITCKYLIKGLNDTVIINNLVLFNNLIKSDKSYFGNNIFMFNNININKNYWARPDGTGYSQICNDTNNDGICDSPYDPINDKIVSLSSNLNNPTLKINTLKLADSYIDYYPLAVWPYVAKEVTNNITYDPNSNAIVATIYSNTSGTTDYNLEVDGAPFNKGNVNLSKGENNVSIPLENIKLCGVQNVTLKIGNQTVTKEIDFGPCEVAGSGGGSYEAPENPLYALVVLIFGIFYLILKEKND